MRMRNMCRLGRRALFSGLRTGLVAAWATLALACLAWPAPASAAAADPLPSLLLQNRPRQTQAVTPSENSPRIVAGSELIADIVRDLLGGDAHVLSLIPPASCPGHHDVRAMDMAFIRNADIIVLHTWQKRQSSVADALKAAGNPRAPIYVEPAASWLIPENRIAALDAIAPLLLSLPGVRQAAAPEQERATMQRRLKAGQTRTAALAAECGRKLAPYAGTKAAVSGMQADFVRRLGLLPAVTFGRAEDTPPAELIRLVATAREQGVRIVVDNLQSGAEAGLPLAEELGVPHLVFSNFPGHVPDLPTYETLLPSLCDQLQKTLRQADAAARKATRQGGDTSDASAGNAWNVPDMKEPADMSSAERGETVPDILDIPDVPEILDIRDMPPGE